MPSSGTPSSASSSPGHGSVVRAVAPLSHRKMSFVRSAVGRPRWSLAAAGRAHALPPLVIAVRRRRKMIHPAARHMRLPAALATGDRLGAGRRPPAAFHGDHIPSVRDVLLQAHDHWLPKLCRAAAARCMSPITYFFRSCSSKIDAISP